MVGSSVAFTSNFWRPIATTRITTPEKESEKKRASNKTNVAIEAYAQVHRRQKNSKATPGMASLFALKNKKQEWSEIEKDKQSVLKTHV